MGNSCSPSKSVQTSEQPTEKTENRINTEDVTIRDADVSDVELIDKIWQKDEAWSAWGARGITFMMDARLCENKGFVAEYNGAVIGSGMAYLIGDNTAGLGCFFVSPDYRYQGIGQLIWDARMDFLSDRNVIVNAKGKRAAKNIKLGFQDSNINLISYFAIAPKIPTDAEVEDIKDHVDSIQPINEVDIDQLVAYDGGIVKNMSCRERYYKTAIQEYKVRGSVAFKDGEIVGVIAESPAQDFVPLGPLYAESKQVAILLLKRFLSEIPPDVPVMVPSPENNKDAAEVMGMFGIEADGVSSYLYNRQPLDMDMGRVYCVCNVMLCI